MTEINIESEAKKLRNIYQMVIDRLNLRISLRDFYPKEWSDEQVNDALLILDRKNPDFIPYGLSLDNWSELPNIIEFFHPDLILKPKLYFSSEDFNETKFEIINNDGEDFFPKKSPKERNFLIRKLVKYDISPHRYPALSAPLFSLLGISDVLDTYDPHSETYKSCYNPISFWLSHQGGYLLRGDLLPYAECEEIYRNYATNFRKGNLWDDRWEHRRVSGPLKKTIKQALEDFAKVLDSYSTFTPLDIKDRRKLQDRLRES